MVKVEFLMKWYIDPTPEEQEEDRKMAAIDSEYSPESRFVLKKLTLDLGNITTFNKAENGYTYVRTSEEAFTIKILYDKFKIIYQDITGCAIKSYKDYQFVEDEDEPESTEEG